ncbi:hypothetical protein V1478_016035, partial [Vespula squamosa]
TFAWQQRKFAAARLPSSREFIKAGAGSRLIPANPPKPCSINIAATQRFSLATELRSVEAGPTWNPRLRRNSRPFLLPSGIITQDTTKIHPSSSTCRENSSESSRSSINPNHNGYRPH